MKAIDISRKLNINNNTIYSVIKRIKNSTPV